MILGGCSWSVWYSWGLSEFCAKAVPELSGDGILDFYRVIWIFGVRFWANSPPPPKKKAYNLSPRCHHIHSKENLS